MATGRVKWFNNTKGYGFILPDSGGGDLFAHYTAIKMEGYKTLKAGQAVTFNTTKGEKGMHAVDITPAPSETAGVQQASPQVSPEAMAVKTQKKPTPLEEAF